MCDFIIIKASLIAYWTSFSFSLNTKFKPVRLKKSRKKSTSLFNLFLLAHLPTKRSIIVSILDKDYLRSDSDLLLKKEPLSIHIKLSLNNKSLSVQKLIFLDLKNALSTKNFLILKVIQSNVINTSLNLLLSSQKFLQNIVIRSKNTITNKQSPIK